MRKVADTSNRLNGFSERLQGKPEFAVGTLQNRELRSVKSHQYASTTVRSAVLGKTYTPERPHKA